MAPTDQFVMTATLSKSAAILALYLGILGILHAAAPDPAPARVPLADLLRRSVRENEIPAMAVVATHADEVLETAVVGVRHAGRPDPVLPTDQFHLGSCTKAMTATMLAVLVEQGKLSWQTRILDVFPEWKGEIDSGYRGVTLTDLLSHRSGLSAYSDFERAYERDDLAAAKGAGSRADQRREFARRVLHHKPVVSPRSKFIYSNADYSVASAMAERVTGQSWETLMRTLLFEPLGIHAIFEWPALDDPNQPWGHRETGTGLRPDDPHGEFQLPAVLAPAGGVAMSPGDYVKFLQLHLQGLKGRDGLLKAGTIKHLHSPVDSSHNESPHEGYAFGWGVAKFEGAWGSNHRGTVGTFFVTVAIWPSRDLAVAVFANAYGTRTESVCMEVLAKMAHRH